MRSVRDRLAPTERGVPADKHRGTVQRIPLPERRNDRDGGVEFIVSWDRFGRQRRTYGHWSAKIIRVRGAEAGDLATRLSPCRSVARMRVRDAADLRECAIERGMCWEIRRGPQVSVYNVPFDVRDNHVRGRHLLVLNTAGFDHDETFLARDAARVSEGVDHEAAANQLEVRLEDLNSQRFQHLFLLGHPPLHARGQRYGAAPARCSRSRSPRSSRARMRNTTFGRSDRAPDKSRLRPPTVPRLCSPGTERPALLRRDETFPQPGTRR